MVGFFDEMYCLRDMPHRVIETLGKKRDVRKMTSFPSIAF